MLQLWVKDPLLWSHHCPASEREEGLGCWCMVLPAFYWLEASHMMACAAETQNSVITKAEELVFAVPVTLTTSTNCQCGGLNSVLLLP
jgi:hypothetical protein